MTGVLIKEGHLDTETDIHRSRTPSNMEAEMGDAPTSQGATKVASKPPEARKEA